MMWLLLAFLSAALLGCYDSFKKEALQANAVIPVLFLNTLFCSLIFLPCILASYHTGSRTRPSSWRAADGMSIAISCSRVS